MTFGNRLKKLRIQRGLRQEALAKIINVHRATVGKYETNKRFPDRETLEKLADYFNVSLDYLFCRTNMKNFPETEKDSFKEKEHYILDISNLPQEAIKQIKDYVEYIKTKYNTTQT